MKDVVIRLSVYFVTLCLGYLMKRVGLFKKEDSAAVTRLILNVALPATAISAFATLDRDFSLLFLVLLGALAGFVVPWLLAAFLTRRKEPATRALYLCNTTTLNMGAFAMPFLQLILPSSAIAGICLFDIGNAVMIHGAVTPVSAAYLRAGGRKYGAREIARHVLTSVAFCTYLSMLILFLLNIKLPSYVYTVTNSLSAPNGFLVMFNLGLLLEFRFPWKQMKEVLGVLGLRLLLSVLFALLFYFALPFDQLLRKGLAMAAFAPTAATCPFMTAQCGGDESQSSLCVTICEIVSGFCLVALILLLP